MAGALALPSPLFDLDAALRCDMARQAIIDMEIAALCRESADLDVRRDVLLDLWCAERVRASR